MAMLLESVCQGSHYALVWWLSWMSFLTEKIRAPHAQCYTPGALADKCANVKPRVSCPAFHYPIPLYSSTSWRVSRSKWKIMSQLIFFKGEVSWLKEALMTHESWCIFQWFFSSGSSKIDQKEGADSWRFVTYYIAKTGFLRTHFGD